MSGELFLNDGRTAELWDAVKKRSIPTKSLTSIEYDSLSEKEKQEDILYIITDDDNYVGEVYSTDEIKIGTWIDGESIYRKVFPNLMTPASSNNLVVIEDLSYIKTITSLFCLIIGDGASVFNYPIPSNVCSFNIYNGVFEFYFTDSFFANKRMRLIIEYTKVTDTSNISQTTLLTSEIDSPVSVIFPSTTSIASSSNIV